MRWSPQYHTACQIQKQILDMMGLEMQQANKTPKVMPMEGREKLKPSELCSLTKAWTELEERKRILRMKPLPKAQEVDRPKDKRKPVQETFRE